LSTQPASEHETQEGALGNRAVTGAAIMFARNGGAQALRLITNLIVSRLLVPEAYGLMALVNILMQGLEMLSDIGVGPAIIRSKRGDEPAFLDTVWTVQLVRGGLSWAIAAAAAIPFAAFYGEPTLAQIIPVAGSIALISSLAPTKRFTLNRELQFGRLTIVDLGAQILGLLVQISLAYVWHSVWALVWGTVATAAVGTLFEHLLLPGRSNRPRWEREARSELFGFGRWVFLSTMLTYLSQSADRLIFGKFLPMNAVGVYSIGKQLSSAPTDAISQISSNVVFALYSRVVTSGQPLAPVYVQARRPLLILAGWGLAILAATGDALVEVMFDDRYLAAGWVLQVLALGSWFNVVWGTNVYALLALGQSKWMAATTLVRTVAIVALIPAGIYVAGFPGAVVAIALSEVIQLAFSTFAVVSNRLARPWHDLPLTGLVFGSAGLSFWVRSNWTSNVWIAVPLGAILVTVLWLPVGWPPLRQLLRDRGFLRGV
jgi:O-antigen/teichoic acid export membrane protein